MRGGWGGRPWWRAVKRAAGTADGACKGAVKVHELSETDLDDFAIELSGVQGPAHRTGAAGKAAKGMRGAIEAAARSLMAEALERQG